MKRLPAAALLLLQAVLVAAAVRPDVKVPDEIDPQLMRANYERWQELPDTERDVLRQRWGRFAALPAGEQETLLQRSDALRRLGDGLRQRLGREPSADETAAELTLLVKDARQLLQRPGAPELGEPEFRNQLEARTRRHLTAFLDNVQKRGDLSPQRRGQLHNEPLSEQIRDALVLLKSQQLPLFAEGLRAEEADEMLRLAPLDVATRAEVRRRQFGFLGGLGQAIQLDEQDRQALQTAASAQEASERLRDLKAPQIRELLTGLGISAAHADELLTGPLNELEREAHAALRAARSTPPQR